MISFHAADLHSYTNKMRELREDFEKLKTTTDENVVNETLEKYERFIELNFKISPWTRIFFYYN